VAGLPILPRARGRGERHRPLPLRRYSATLADMGGAWTPENLNGFLENPSGYAPGTSMSYSGMRDAEDRANLIAYLATFAG